MQPLKPTDVRRAAMDLLAFREHSVQELVEKLSRRFQKRRSNVSGSNVTSGNAFGKKASKSKSHNKPCSSNKPYYGEVSGSYAGDDDLSFDETSGVDEYSQAQQQEADLDVIVEQVQQLRAENLQSDQRYGESFVRSRVNKGQGPQRIRSEMIARGLAESLVAEVLAEAQVDWDQTLAELALRKYGNTAPRDDKERAKRVRFYLYRGFNYEYVKNLED